MIYYTIPLYCTILASLVSAEALAPHAENGLYPPFGVYRSIVLFAILLVTALKFRALFYGPRSSNMFRNALNASCALVTMNALYLIIRRRFHAALFTGTSLILPFLFGSLIEGPLTLFMTAECPPYMHIVSPINFANYDPSTVAGLTNIGEALKEYKEEYLKVLAGGDQQNFFKLNHPIEYLKLVKSNENHMKAKSLNHISALLETLSHPNFQAYPSEFRVTQSQYTDIMGQSHIAPHILQPIVDGLKAEIALKVQHPGNIVFDSSETADLLINSLRDIGMDDKALCIYYNTLYSAAVAKGSILGVDKIDSTLGFDDFLDAAYKARKEIDDIIAYLQKSSDHIVKFIAEENPKNLPEQQKKSKQPDISALQALKDKSHALAQSMLSKIPDDAQLRQLDLIQVCNLYISVKKKEKILIAADSALKRLLARIKEATTDLAKTELSEDNLMKYTEALSNVLKCDKKTLSAPISALKALFVEQEILLSTDRGSLLDKLLLKCTNFPDALKLFKALYSAFLKKGLENAAQFPFNLFFKHLHSLVAKGDIDFIFATMQLKQYANVTEKQLGISEAATPAFAPALALILKEYLLNPKLDAALIKVDGQPVEKFMQLLALIKKLLSFIPDETNLAAILADERNPMTAFGAALVLKDKLDSFIANVKALVKDNAFIEGVKTKKRKLADLLNALKEKNKALTMAKVNGTNSAMFDGIDQQISSYFQKT